MNNTPKLQSIISEFEFKKAVYSGAEHQLGRFADAFALLSLEEANALRSKYDAKIRLGWFGIAAALVKEKFETANVSCKEKLIRIFLAMYSFDNLEFGYDSMLHLMSVSEKIRVNKDLAQKQWDIFCKLTSNQTAIRNLESKLFYSLSDTVKTV